jgi:hypothetical protein
MLVYTNLKGKELIHKCKQNVCGACGGPVNAFWDADTKKIFIACSQYPATKHETIAREAEVQTIRGKYIIQMEEQMGETKALSLRQYQGLTTLTSDQAKEILTTVWPKANGVELYKAMNICTTYGLNPLMRHLYMIPFGDKLVCVMGIGASRLIASRKHNFSYIDDTPRIMSEAEEIKRYGKPDPGKVRFVTKLKDVKTGAEASGWGEISANATIQGADKGNSKENMAAIRSERQALDRLYPADMPAADIPVVDDNYIESTATVIEEPVKEPDTIAAPSPANPPATQQDGQETVEKPLPIDQQWLTETLAIVKWTQLTACTYIKSTYKVMVAKTLDETLRIIPADVTEKFYKHLVEMREASGK